MNKRINYILLFSLFLLLSCNDEQEGTPNTKPEVQGKTIALTFTSQPLQESGVVTRSIGKDMDLIMGDRTDASTRTIPADEKIDNVCIFQFEGSKESSNAVLRAMFYQENLTDNTLSMTLASTSSSCFLYVCANVGDLTSNYTVGSSTFQKLMDASLIVSGQYGSNSSLPMSGCADIGDKDAVSITLFRMLAKVTFTCDLSQLPIGDIFKITGVTLYNVPQSATYYPLVGNVVSSVIDVNLLVGAPVVSGNSKTTYTWYIPENLRGVGKLTLSSGEWTKRIEKNAPNYATYIELMGDYTASGNDKIPGVTYVIYLGDGIDVNNYDVQRNHSYQLTARIKGMNTAADLRVSIGADLSADGLANCYLADKDNRWYRFNGTVRGNGNAEDYAYKMYGLSMLPTDGVNIKNINDAVVVWETAEGLISELHWDKKSGFVRFKTGTAKGNALIAVRNTSKEILWSWHIWRTDGVDLATLNAQYTLDIETNTDRSWYKEIAPNAARKRTLTILDRNIGAAFNGTNITIDDNKGAYCLHYQFGRKDPFPAGITYNNDDKICDGDITLYGYRTGTKTEYTIFSKVKPASAAGSTASAVLEYIKQNPEVFLYSQNWIVNSPVNSDNWKISNCLWGDENLLVAPDELSFSSYIYADPNPWDGKKTIYDPSPAGWRVAPADTWTGITKTEVKWGLIDIQYTYRSGDWVTGWWVYFNNNPAIKTFLPASGLRYTQGKLSHAGSRGYNWLSSPAGQNCDFGTYAESNRVDMRLSTIVSRGYGFPIRCVQYNEKQ